MAYLLDVDVLIARCDPTHEFHERVRDWLREHAGRPIVLCPATEMNFVRVFGSAEYPGGPGSPEAAIGVLRLMYKRLNAVFAHDDLSLRNEGQFATFAGVEPRDVQAVYLLTLAASRGVQFVTLNARLDPRLLPKAAAKALTVIR
ncbi:MAG: hypothetical protein EA428_14110 [Spirochaetaceae bacterium]|nr:MAG: hypothetical protein EA428_14110 [Spirochaetaceae bacterium]